MALTLSCGGKPGVTGPKKIEAKVANNVWVLDSLSRISVQDISGATFLITDTDFSLKVGDILVGTQPYGYLVRIIEITPAGNQLQVRTEDAALTDAVIEGTLDTAFWLERQVGETGEIAGGELLFLAEGVTRTAGSVDISGLHLFAGEAGGVDLDILIKSGLIGFDPAIDVKLLIAGSELADWRIVVGGAFDIRCHATIVANGAVQRSGRVPIATLRSVAIHHIGPVPILQEILMHLDIEYEINLEGSDSLILDVGGQYSLLSGLKSGDDGVLTIWDPESWEQNQSVRWRGRADAHCTIRFMLTTNSRFYTRTAFTGTAASSYTIDGTWHTPLLWEWALSSELTGRAAMDLGALNSDQAGYASTFSAPKQVLATKSGPYIGTWTKTIGGAGDEVAHAVAAASDGTFLIVGSTTSLGAGATDAYLVKIDHQGNVLWERTFGGTENDYGYDLAPTSDGGCIMSGDTRSYGSGNRRALLVRVDAAGNTLWQRQFGINATCAALVLTRDGGCIVTGYGKLKRVNTSGLYLARFDSSGTLLWERTFPGVSSGRSIIETGVEKFVITGKVNTWRQADVLLLQVDGSGREIWRHAYGGDFADVGEMVITTADGGLAVTGYTRRRAGYGWVYRAYLVRTTDNGQYLFSRSYGNSEETLDYFGGLIAPVPGGGYIIGGLRTGVAELGNVSLMGVSGNGKTIWERSYGGDGYDEASAITATPDGGYIIAGRTGSYGAGGFDMYLLKVNGEGEL